MEKADRFGVLPSPRTTKVNVAGLLRNYAVAPEMQLVIIAARNRTKSFNKLLAGKSPCRWRGLVQVKQGAQTLWHWLHDLDLKA